MSDIQASIMSFLRERNTRRHLTVIVCMIAAATVLAVFWSLHIKGITLSSGDLVCGMEEHTHTVDCYAWVPVVDETEDGSELEETESVSETGEISAAETASETEESTVTETSFATTTEFAAESVSAETGTEALTEDETETLTEEETEVAQVGNTKFIDGVEYVYTLICGMEEHTHTDECYADDEDSEETETEESANVSSLTAGVSSLGVTRLGSSDPSAGVSAISEDSDGNSGISTASEEERILLTTTALSSTVLDATSGDTYYFADAVTWENVDKAGGTQYVVYTKIGTTYYLLDANGRLRKVNDTDSGKTISWASDNNIGFYQWNVTEGTSTYTIYNSTYDQYLSPTYTPGSGTGNDVTITSWRSSNTGEVTLSGDFELTYTFTNTCNGSNYYDNYIVEMFTDDGTRLVFRADNYGWVETSDYTIYSNGDIYVGQTLQSGYPSTASSNDTISFEATSVDFDSWLSSMKAGEAVTVNLVKSGSTVTAFLRAGGVTFTATAKVEEFENEDVTIYLTGEKCKISDVQYEYICTTSENSEASSYKSGEANDLSLTTGFAGNTANVELSGDFVLTYSFANESNVLTSGTTEATYYNYILEMHDSSYVYLDVRADNYGWLANQDSSIDTLTFGDGSSDWDEWLDNMQAGEEVTVKVERIGGYVTVTTTAAGETFTATAYISEYADGRALSVYLTGEECDLSDITYTYYTPAAMRTASTSAEITITADASDQYAWTGTATIDSSMRSGDYALTAQADTGYIEWTDGTDCLECLETCDASEGITFYFAKVRSYSVYFDGTNGGIYSNSKDPKGGEPLVKTVAAYAMDEDGTLFYVTVPDIYINDNADSSGSRYDYIVNGWFDIINAKYYSATYGDTITFAYSTTSDSTTCYVDWIADDYNGGSSAYSISDVVDTSTFITTDVFDYNDLFNLNSAYYNADESAWYFTYAGYQDGNNEDILNIFGKTGWGFIFFTNPAGTLLAPNGRALNTIGINGRSFTINGLNNDNSTGDSYGPTAGILTDSTVTSNLLKYLFDTGSDSEYGAYSSTNTSGVIGKTYLGKGDYLYQYDVTSGYYYYDSSVNAAFYNQDEQRFYLYDFKVKANVTGSDSDFLPFDYDYVSSPEKLTSADTASISAANIDYYFGMCTTIDFYLPDSTSEYAVSGKKVNQTSNENGYSDMVFKFSGDDDVWVILDYGTSNETLLLDIGGIHSQIYGEINFSTGTVKVFNNLESSDGTTTYIGYDSNNIIGILDESGVSNTYTINVGAGTHTLSVFYLERGASQSNLAISCNLTSSTYNLNLSKVDEDGKSLGTDAEFTFYDENGDEVKLAEVLQGEDTTSTFSAGSVAYGLREGVTYTVKETTTPSGYTAEGKYFTVCLEGTVLTITVYDSADNILEQYEYTITVGTNGGACTYNLDTKTSASSWSYVYDASALSVSATISGGTVAYYDIAFAIANTKEYELAETGGVGISQYHRIGVILAVVSITGLLIIAFYNIVWIRRFRAIAYNKEYTEDKIKQQKCFARMRGHPRERSITHGHARDRPSIRTVSSADGNTERSRGTGPGKT